MAPDQQLGVAGVLDADLAHHLADDDLNVLVVDVDALLTVDLLDLLDEVVAHALAAELVVVDTADAEDVVRVERACGELLALIHWLAVVDCRTRGVGDGVDPGIALASLRDGDGDTGRCGGFRRWRRCRRPPQDLRHLLGRRASKSSSTRGRPWVMSSPAMPPEWKVRMVSWVPGSPMDWAAMMPTASPRLTSSEVARFMP